MVRPTDWFLILNRQLVKKEMKPLGSGHNQTAKGGLWEQCIYVAGTSVGGKAVDARSFLVGVMVYEMLAGKPPLMARMRWRQSVNPK
jgi:hypothetical protein